MGLGAKPRWMSRGFSRAVHATVGRCLFRSLPLPCFVGFADRLLLFTCAVLVLSGPAMALQEYSRVDQERAVRELTGAQPTPDLTFRTLWRTGLLVLIIVAAVVGSLLAMRFARQKRVRAVSGRLLFLLLAGMTILDLAFLTDGAWFMEKPHELRALTIVWAYPVGALLVAGATYRLLEVEALFGDARAFPTVGSAEPGAP